MRYWGTKETVSFNRNNTDQFWSSIKPLVNSDLMQKSTVVSAVIAMQ